MEAPLQHITISKGGYDYPLEFVWEKWWYDTPKMNPQTFGEEMFLVGILNH